MKKILYPTVLLLTAACSLFQIDWQTGLFQAVLDRAREKRKPILVYFSSPSCSVCRRLEKTFFNNRQVISVINRDFVPFKVVKGVGEGDRLVEFFQVSAYPTLVVLGSDALERDRTIGFDGDAAGLLEMVKDFAADRRTLLSYLRRFSEDTTDAEWAYRIAERYIKRGQNDLAEHFFARVQRLDPHNLSGHRAAADFYLALAKFRRQGDDSLLTALLENENDKDRLQRGFRALISAAENRALAGDTSAITETLTLYEKALHRLPDSILLLNACAWFIYQAKAKEHVFWGIRLAERAAALAPNNEEIWDTLAWLYHDAGRYGDATAAMKRAAKLNPNAEYYRRTLAQMERDATR